MVHIQKNETFWLEDPLVLITNICSFNPLSRETFSYNLNSYTRLIIILIVILLCIKQDYRYIIVGVVLIVLIIILYYTCKKDNFGNLHDLNNLKLTGESLLNEEMKPRKKSDYYNTQENVNNPLKNTQIPEYDTNTDFSEATQSNYNTTKFVNGKMFQTPDQWIFDKGTRQYYTVANTQVPNDQGTFANWLYGTENICKEGSIYSRRTGTPEQTLNCNGFNVATPTNFGNLNDYVKDTQSSNYVNSN